MKKVTLCALWMIILLGAVCMPAKAKNDVQVFSTSMDNPSQWADKFALSGQQPYVQVYVNPDSVKKVLYRGSYTNEVFTVLIVGYPKYSNTNPHLMELMFFDGKIFGVENPVPTDNYRKDTTDNLLGKVEVQYDHASNLTNNKPSIRVYVDYLPFEYTWTFNVRLRLKNNENKYDYSKEAVPLMFDDNLYMPIDPILDMTVADSQIGQQTINFTSVASITHYTLYKKGNPNITIASKTISPSANNVAIPVPRCQSQQTYWLGVDLHTDKKNYYIDRPIVVKPFHAIGTTSCFQANNTNRYGLRNPSNIISWSVPCAQDTDALADDVFLIERATYSDFSDGMTIGTHSLTPDTVVNGFGYYRYVDNDEQALTNSHARDKNDPYMYYRISRVMVQSV